MHGRRRPHLRRTLHTLDGVATTAELRARGFPGPRLSAAVHTGELLRVRRGWYALPEVDPNLRAAIRVGGRLACVSAAAFYGWSTPPRHGVHVAVPENAARLRTAGTAQRTVVHWASPIPRARRSRLITEPFETVVQIAHCQSPEFAVAAFDSYLAQHDGSPRQLERWLAEVPPHIRNALPRREPLCHSFLETIGRVRLESDGIRGEHQVQIPGIGRVDLVIDGWLVIEWDGRTHLEPDQRDEDDRRDAMLTAMGYRVLRFSYGTVMDRWYLVIAAVRAMLNGDTRAGF